MSALIEPAEMTAKFRKRARWSRISAIVTVVIILYVIVLGFLYFEGIGNRTDNSAAAREATDAAEVALLQEDFRAAEAVIKSGDASLDQKRRAREDKRSLQRAAARIGYVLSITEDGKSTFKKVGNPAEDNEWYSQQRYLSSLFSFANRLTYVVLVFIVLQVVVSVFRYNLRLAAFYDARADALELAGYTDDVTFERLVQTLSPDSYDFGKAPKTPADHGVELAKSIISRTK